GLRGPGAGRAHRGAARQQAGRRLPVAGGVRPPGAARRSLLGGAGPGGRSRRRGGQPRGGRPAADRAAQAPRMRQLALEKAVVKDLLALPPKQYRQVVSAVFDLLAEPQYAKALRGSPYLRIAVGEYRIVYRADAECMYVVVAGKRNDSEVYSR